MCQQAAAIGQGRPAFVGTETRAAACRQHQRDHTHSATTAVSALAFTSSSEPGARGAEP